MRARDVAILIAQEAFCIPNHTVARAAIYGPMMANHITMPHSTITLARAYCALLRCLDSLILFLSSIGKSGSLLSLHQHVW